MKRSVSAKRVSIPAVVAVACGVGLSMLSGQVNLTTSAIAAPPSPVAVYNPDLTGRWTGTPRGYSDIVKNCGSEGCKLILDVTRCGEAYCGIRVEHDGTCSPGVAMKISTKPHDPTLGDADDSVARYEGKLELAANSQPFVIEMTVWDFKRADGTLVPQLSIIGDTGAEMLLLRRSFPLQANLMLTGAPVCKPDKPVS